MKRERIVFECKQLIRKTYCGVLCPQTCLLCGRNTEKALPLCTRCIETEFHPYLDMHKSSVDGEIRRCRRCGKILISEIDYCTRCRGSRTDDTLPDFACSRVFTLFPYIGLGQKLLPVWKNQGIRSCSAVFAPLIYAFLAQNPELAALPLVPVPPRPKKIREQGWDQIEDLVRDLAVFPKLTVCRCLTREDGVPQKKLSKSERAMNLQGKIRVTVKPVPEKLIVLDDVMTTGATLEVCARALKEQGAQKVYGICLFFD